MVYSNQRGTISVSNVYLFRPLYLSAAFLHYWLGFRQENPGEVVSTIREETGLLHNLNPDNPENKRTDVRGRSARKQANILARKP